MFSNDDLKSRVQKMEQEVDRLKSFQTEVMRVSFQVANLSDKMDANFKSVNSTLESIDKRLGRLEMLFYGLLVGIVTVFIGGLATTVLAFPALRMQLFS